MNFDEYLAQIPKVELHCHLPGSVRAETIIELGRKYGVGLRAWEPDELFTYSSILDFLDVLGSVGKCIRTRDEFARVAYECLEDEVKSSNLRYREMFFSPTYHYEQGVSYVTVVDGLLDGIQQAESDYGVKCRLIAGISRKDSHAVVMKMMDDIVLNPRDEMIGIAQDDLRRDGLEVPEEWAPAYEIAKKHGLKRTAHVGENASSSAKEIYTAIDLLGCDRIDHGYRIIETPDAIRRARDEGWHFTTCVTTTAKCYGWSDIEIHPIRRMLEEGLSVGLNTDDPSMFQTTLTREFQLGCNNWGLGPKEARQLVMGAVDGSWADESEKRSMRDEFGREFDRLDAELEI